MLVSFSGWRAIFLGITNMNVNLKEYLSEFSQIVLPRECIVCNDICINIICDSCYSKMVMIENNFCTICGGACEESSGICINCENAPPYFTNCCSAVKYNKTSSNIVRSLKYSSRIEAADFMAQIMNEKINLKDNFHIITSIPIHPLKRIIKNFNHSEILAKEFAKIHNIPYKKLLRRVKFNKRQVRVSYEDRIQNVNGIFSLINKDIVKNKKILLIDDVTTTGATLNEAARILFMNGALPSAITFANARY